MRVSTPRIPELATPSQSSEVVLFGLIATALVTGALFVWDSVLAPLLIAGAVCGAAVALYLLGRPLLALWVALFFRVLHWGEPETEFLTVWQHIANAFFAVALGAWLLDLIRRRRPILLDPVVFFLGIYILWACITLMWTFNISEGFEEVRRYIAGALMVFLVVQVIRTLPDVDYLMLLLAIIGWVFVVYGFISIPLTDYQIGDRLKMPGVNPNEIGPTLVQMLPGVIWPILRAPRGAKLHVILCLAYLLGALILTLLSGSRGGILSMVAAIFALSFWKPLRKWSLAAVLLLPALIVAAPFLFETLSNRLEEDSELGKRDVLVFASLKIIEQHPLTGVGIGSGPFEIPRYIDWQLGERCCRLPAHNPILEAGVDTGIPGMFLYLLVLLAALLQFNHGRRRWRDGPMAAYFPIVASCGMGYFLAWIKGGGMENDPSFFLMLAMMTLPAQLSDQAESSAADDALRSMTDPSGPDGKPESLSHAPANDSASVTEEQIDARENRSDHKVGTPCE